MRPLCRSSWKHSALVAEKERTAGAGRRDRTPSFVRRRLGLASHFRLSLALGLFAHPGIVKECLSPEPWTWTNDVAAVCRSDQLKSDDDSATKTSPGCQLPMRSPVGPGSLSEQSKFRACCRSDRASAACFAAAAHSGSDDTLALQAALNCSTELLKVESGHTWLVQPLILTSTGPKHVWIESGVRIEALSGAFHGAKDALLTVFEAENVTVQAAGAVIHMRKEDYVNPSLYSHSEHRHALKIVGAQHLTIVGLHVNNSGGDGVYVTGSYDSWCKRFVATHGLDLRSVVSTRNYRQGMSVISASKMLATNCTFAETGVGGYTSPAAGVDIEPGSPTNILDGIRFVGCTATNNTGAGFNLSPSYGGFATKTNVTISFEGCMVNGGLGPGFSSGTGGRTWPMGQVNVDNCRVSDTAGAGIVFRDVASGLEVSYRNFTLTNVAIGYAGTRGPHSGTGTWPWWNASIGPPLPSSPIEVSHVSHDVSFPIGQLTITGLRATDNLSRPFLHADAPHNLSLTEGGLRQILVEGIVQAQSDNATKQCTPIGIESDSRWGVDVSSLICAVGG